MSEGDAGLARLEAALDRLELALVRRAAAPAPDDDGQAAALGEECERLRAENAALRARAVEDAELRAEAAAAVKAALEDLRALMEDADHG